VLPGSPQPASEKPIAASAAIIAKNLVLFVMPFLLNACANFARAIAKISPSRFAGARVEPDPRDAARHRPRIGNAADSRLSSLSIFFRAS